MSRSSLRHRVRCHRVGLGRVIARSVGRGNRASARLVTPVTFHQPALASGS